MKELSIEEKARAYDDALERMKSWVRGEHPECFTEAQKAAEFIFPEFKESDENKVKRILHSISSKMSFHLHDIFTEEEFQCFDAWSHDWLEKQGESDETKAKMFLINNGYPIDANGTFPTYEEIYNIIIEGLEHQGWQKNKINSYKITFEDVLALECAMKTVKITEGGNELYELLVHLYNKIHNAYLVEKQGEQKYKIIKGKNYFCVNTHNYAGVEWIKGTKYYASDNYTMVNQGCEYYCPEYSKEEHNNLFEEVKYDDGNG